MKKLFTAFWFSFFFLIFLLSHATIIPVAASDNIGPWTLSSYLPYRIASHISFVSPNKIHTVAGATNYATNVISYAGINDNGSLSLWHESPNNYPGSIYWHSQARKNNYIYGLGGTTYPPAESIDRVFLGIINNDLISNWIPLTPLPNQLSLGNAVVVGNYLYFAGGQRYVEGYLVETSSMVYMAEINPNGTIGDWTTTTNLPTPLYGFGMVEAVNKIIIIGGTKDTGEDTDKVYEATVNPLDGSLDFWIEKDPLPRPVHRSGITKIDSTVISVGGVDDGEYLNQVFYAPTGISGSIGSWSESSTVFPHRWCCGALVNTDTHLYYTGGHDGNNYFDTTYVASFGDTTPPSVLDIPDIKQYNSLWKDEEYDTASDWSENPTIERWGCGLTSASMILQSYNHGINPDDLNNWLNSHQGYTRNGGVWWPAVSWYSETFSDYDSPVLELDWSDYNPNIVESELENERAVIVRHPDPIHFVVVKGKTDSDFVINDPGAENFTFLSQSASTHSTPDALKLFTPSKTDLSYLGLVVDSDLTLEVFNPEGNEILDHFYFQSPLTDNTNGTLLNSETLKIFQYPKPQKGTYAVYISGSAGSYQLDTYLHNERGEVNFAELSGELDEDEKHIYLINFDKENSKNSSISEISFESIIEELDRGFNEGFIKNRGLYRALQRLVRYAQRFLKLGFKYHSKRLLSVTLRYIKIYTPRLIDRQYSSLLQTKIKLLRDSI